KDPDLEWVIGVNCKKDWSPDVKKRYVQPMLDWARRIREMLMRGERFPASWPRDVSVWIVDDLGLVFETGETLIGVSFDLCVRSPLKETLLMSLCNGADAYLGTD